MSWEGETGIWHPTAGALHLPYAPEGQKDRLRERLRPWLERLHRVDGTPIGLGGGQCFEIAQALTATAKDPSVLYVEGVWGASSPDIDEISYPERHGWNYVDGVRIDLLDERYRCVGGRFSQFVRHYQSLASYTWASIQGVIDNRITLDCHDISGSLRLWNSAGYQRLLGKASDQEIRKYWNDHLDAATAEAFQPAIDRFIAHFGVGEKV